MNFAATQSGHILRISEFGAEMLTLLDARKLEDVFQTLILQHEGDIQEAALRRAAISLTGAIMAVQEMSLPPRGAATLH
ncbi:MAG: hypothetical protein IT546_11850 [Caulobacteraceae bacterium]|nr:hypothetical protein [Caulobacteraceae bacterium]